MNTIHDANLDRVSELLADRATQKLTTAESAELIALLASRPVVDEHCFDRVAAAADLSAIAREYEPLPDTARARIDASAVAWLAQRKGFTLAGSGPTAPADKNRPLPETPRRRGAERTWIPWLAAAACLAVAVISWWPTGGRDPSPAAQREALAARPGSRTIAWAPNEAGVSGDVVWNNEEQAGFLRIRGLGVNDPKVEQYQLWVFDEGRRAYSDDVAVDGGVFDIDQATGDAIVPIDAKLPIYDPTLFAVTTEPPGGVVKHNQQRDPDRFRIVLTASL
jgi:hypothetical protein